MDSQPADNRSLGAGGGDGVAKIGGTETQRIITIKRTLKDLQFLYLFLPGKLMASTARLSFFYRHHNAYRIQEMPNHNSSTWENESELIHFFVSRILDESKLIHSGAYTNLYWCPV